VREKTKITHAKTLEAQRKYCRKLIDRVITLTCQLDQPDCRDFPA
jgi:hypothetical protein